MKKIRVPFGVWLGCCVVLLTSCASARTSTVYSGEGEAFPDRELAGYVRAYQEAKSSGRSMESARDRLADLAARHPNHVPTLLANAIAAREAARPAESQKYLDRVLLIQPLHAPAVVLRSRLALQDGNLTFARRFLEGKIRLLPAEAGLREALAAVLFFQKEYAAAVSALREAERLGAPEGRVLYHLGLLEEFQGNFREASYYYQSALDTQPPFEPARARWAALKS